MGHYQGVETVTINQAREIADVSRRTIYNWIATNKIEWLRTAGGQIRIVAASLWREHPVERSA